jgi:GntR family transcriptional repressor for pyruvate dehydrogenase complex
MATGNGAPLADVAVPVAETDRVYQALRIAIRDGEVVPGQRLASERKLSSDLGAPRAAVRRALQRLTAEGLVERGLGRAGSRVRPAAGAAAGPRAASPQDVLEARWAVEPGLVPLVVARATADDFAAMDRQLDRMAQAATQQEFREGGYGFHLALTRATRNPLLVAIFELIIEARARAGWGRLAALNATPEQRAAQIARNRRVVEALRQRDVPLATAALRGHLAAMLDDIARGPVEDAPALARRRGEGTDRA